MSHSNFHSDLKTLTQGGEVAKLFAKHFKLGEQLAHCSKACFGAAVGTPDRVGKLLEASGDVKKKESTKGAKPDKSTRTKSNGGLSLTSTALLILDISHRDEKQRTMLTIPEARDALFKLVLNRLDILDRLKSGRMKILLLHSHSNVKTKKVK